MRARTILVALAEVEPARHHVHDLPGAGDERDRLLARPEEPRRERARLGDGGDVGRLRVIRHGRSFSASASRPARGPPRAGRTLARGVEVSDALERREALRPAWRHALDHLRGFGERGLGGEERLLDVIRGVRRREEGRLELRGRQVDAALEHARGRSAPKRFVSRRAALAASKTGSSEKKTVSIEPTRFTCTGTFAGRARRRRARRRARRELPRASRRPRRS